MTYAVRVTTKRGAVLELYTRAASPSEAVQLVADYWQRHGMTPYTGITAAEYREEVTA